MTMLMRSSNMTQAPANIPASQGSVLRRIIAGVLASQERSMIQVTPDAARNRAGIPLVTVGDEAFGGEFADERAFTHLVEIIGRGADGDAVRALLDENEIVGFLDAKLHGP